MIEIIEQDVNLKLLSKGEIFPFSTEMFWSFPGVYWLVLFDKDIYRARRDQAREPLNMFTELRLKGNIASYMNLNQGTMSFERKPFKGLSKLCIWTVNKVDIHI